MKQVTKSIKYRDEEYKIVFNLNVMEIIQEEYGSIEAWGALTDGKSGEPNIKALIFGLSAMINEGIEIDNEETGSNKPLLDKKKVGRMITEVGLAMATDTINGVVIESVKSDEKNA